MPHIEGIAMPEAAQKRLEQIRALSVKDRRWIADELWEESPATDDEIAELENDPEFQAMLAERLRQVEEHPELLLDGDQVLAELRRRFGGGAS
jgi:hypothetical protein